MTNAKPALVRQVRSLLKQEAKGNPKVQILTKAELKIKHRIDLVRDEVDGVFRSRILYRIIPNLLITSPEIKYLNEAARKMSGRYVKINRKVFFVIPGADTRGVPEDFEIRFLAGWRFTSAGEPERIP